MGDLTANFSSAEFACQCGCDCADMDAEFMGRLQAVREAYGKPMRITSGYRCPTHNSNVSSTGENGPHTTGRAADVAVSGNDAHRLLAIALEQGMTGVGVKQKGPHGGRFIHLDNLTEGARPWCWSY